MKITSITFIPLLNRVQVLVEFDYKGEKQYTVVYFNPFEENITKDITSMETDTRFIEICNEIIGLKITELDRPEVEF